jgi:hypothetical protein
VFREYILLVLVAVLVHAGTLGAGVEGQEVARVQQAARAKTAITNRGTGQEATVTIELQDGTILEYYIWEAGAESFTLVGARNREVTTVAYADVTKVDKRRAEWVSLLIFVGVGIGALTAAMVIALVAAGGP